MHMCRERERLIGLGSHGGSRKGHAVICLKTIHMGLAAAAEPDNWNPTYHRDD